MQSAILFSSLHLTVELKKNLLLENLIHHREPNCNNHYCSEFLAGASAQFFRKLQKGAVVRQRSLKFVDVNVSGLQGPT